LPPPSMTTFSLRSLKTLAVSSSVIVTGSWPQSKVTTPPLATAATKALDVQLAGVPLPTTVVGWETSSRAASSGTWQSSATLVGATAASADSDEEAAPACGAPSSACGWSSSGCGADALLAPRAVVSPARLPGVDAVGSGGTVALAMATPASTAGT